jgi:hypothetical protein
MPEDRNYFLTLLLKWCAFATAKCKQIRLKFWTTLLSALFSLGLLGIIVGTAQVYVGLSGTRSQFDASAMLTTLSILQFLLTTFTASAVSQILECLQWKFISSTSETSAFKLLGISPTTGYLGSLKIASFSSVRSSDRCWSIFKVILVGLSPLAGALLFCRCQFLSLLLKFLIFEVGTSLVTNYQSSFVYNITAGIGQYNGSFVEPYLEKLQSHGGNSTQKVLPYSSLARAYNLVSNPIHTVSMPPIDCTGEGCYSFLMTGGLDLTTPLPHMESPSSPLVEIPEVMGRQIEYQMGLADGDVLGESDCTMYSDDITIIAIRFCLAESRVNDGAFIAGMYFLVWFNIMLTIKRGLFVCTNGASDGKCINSGDTMPNITATISVYHRKSTIITSRANFSIISVISVTDPIKDPPIDLRSFRQAMDWLLNFNATGIPAAASIAQFFWSAQLQLSNPYWKAEIETTFQSIIAYPMWLFHWNNFGNVNLSAQVMDPNLPPEFYTVAKLVKPITRIVLNKVMFSLFLIGEGLTLVVVFAVLGWLQRTTSEIPILSAFPLMDFITKAKYDFQTRDAIEGETSESEVQYAGSRKILNHLKSCESIVLAKDRVFTGEKNILARTSNSSEYIALCDSEAGATSANLGRDMAGSVPATVIDRSTQPSPENAVGQRRYTS